MASGLIKQSFSGSNARGNWYKDSDHLMIQWGFNTYTSGTTIKYVDSIYYLSLIISYPLTFTTFWFGGSSCRFDTGLSQPLTMAPAGNELGRGSFIAQDGVTRTATSSNYWRVKWWAIGTW